MKTLSTWTKSDWIAVSLTIIWFSFITTIAIIYGG